MAARLMLCDIQSPPLEYDGIAAPLMRLGFNDRGDMRVTPMIMLLYKTPC